MITEEAASEDLDVSMTMQPQLFFVPFPVFVFLAVGMFATGTLLHTWKVIFFFPPAWGGFFLLCKRDHAAMRVLYAHLYLLKAWVTAYRYGGWSTSPPAGLRSRPEIIDDAL